MEGKIWILISARRFHMRNGTPIYYDDYDFFDISALIITIIINWCPIFLNKIIKQIFYTTFKKLPKLSLTITHKRYIKNDLVL
jgi:hypothetical protein